MRTLPLAVLLLLTPTLRADNWPAFRGPDGAGLAAGKAPPATWDASHNVLWKTAIPGAGWSSPIVWGRRVFVTAAVSDEKPTPPRKGLYITDLQGKSLAGEHRWNVYCLDADTGKVLWTRTAFQGKAPGRVHIKNTLASETPVTDGKHVIAYFGNVGVACFSLDGQERWKKKTPAHPMRMGWGTAASPALHDGKLFIVHDNEEKSFLLALDAATGKQLWRVERQEKSNWVTPLVWKNDRRTELVTAGSGRVRSYDLDGKLLWELKGMSILAIPSPFTAGGLLYVTSGYVLDLNQPLYAIRPGAMGDISLRKDETSNRSIAWTQPLAGPYHPTPIVYQGLLYVLYDRGMLACYDAKSGKEVYKKRLGGGSSAFTASPWAADGKVFCLSEDGDTHVVQAGREFKVLGRNRLGEMCLATPAIAGGSLFIRTQGRVYCVRGGDR
jgi:outer membrane protein assembly factor BamB